MVSGSACLGTRSRLALPSVEPFAQIEGRVAGVLRCTVQYMCEPAGDLSPLSHTPATGQGSPVGYIWRSEVRFVVPKIPLSIGALWTHARTMRGSGHGQGVQSGCKRGLGLAGVWGGSPSRGLGREPQRGAGRSPAMKKTTTLGPKTATFSPEMVTTPHLAHATRCAHRPPQAASTCGAVTLGYR